MEEDKTQIIGTGNHPNSRKNLELGRYVGLAMEKNPAWKGDKGSYRTFHIWLKYYYGKANRCQNPNCIYPRIVSRKIVAEPKRFEWALRKGKTHSHIRSNYIQLCASCHRLYDHGGLEVG